MFTMTQNKVSEEQLKEMSVEECLQLRKDLQAQLQMILEANPGVIQRLLTKINERLFEHNYKAGSIFPNEIFEG